MRGLSKGLLCLVTAAFASAANADIIIDGQRLTLSDVREYTVTVNDGVYTIDITTREGWTLAPAAAQTPVDCVATPNDPACQPPTPPPPPPPPTTTGVGTTLTANTTVAELGDTVTFTWSANDAVFCDTKWGNNEWKQYVPNPAGGSVGIVMDLLGETQFRMRCDDASGNSQAVGVFITVEPRATQPNTCDAPQVWNGTEVSWQEYLGDFYPNVSNAEQRKIIRRSDYVAISFNTGNADVRGLFQTIQVSDPNRFVSVNECPGRFTDADPGCYNRQSNGQEIQWSTDGTFGNCTLKKNTDYFLNITYVNVEQESASTLCDTSSCAFNLKVVTQESP